MYSFFIGNPYHFKNTKSSQFFIEIVKKIIPDIQITDNIEFIPKFNIHTLIIWQQLIDPEEIDFLHPKNVILVPMYDDCPLEIDGWLKYKKYKILCFSKYLYNLLYENGFNCFYSQYYIKPNVLLGTQIKNNINAFFWERTERLNWTLIRQICKYLPLSHLHFHTGLTKNIDLTLRPNEEETKQYNITYTDWFENKDDLNMILSNTQIYFAPRKEEGIGMSFIEAIAAGSIVVAYDSSTMNEYINNENGILYSENTLPIKAYTVKDLQDIQAKSIIQAEIGYKKWIDSIPNLLSFISEPMLDYKPKYKISLIKKYGIRFLKKIIKDICFYDFVKSKIFK